jgi:hypothetical protein
MTQPITGILRTSAAQCRQFDGWLELTAAIDDACGRRHPGGVRQERASAPQTSKPEVRRLALHEAHEGVSNPPVSCVRGIPYTVLLRGTGQIGLHQSLAGRLEHRLQTFPISKEDNLPNPAVITAGNFLFATPHRPETERDILLRVARQRRSARRKQRVASTFLHERRLPALAISGPAPDANARSVSKAAWR